MAKKKGPKKSPRKESTSETTVELRVPAEIFRLAMEVEGSDPEALRSILIAILGSDQLFGIDTVILTSSEEGEPGKGAKRVYRKSC